MTTKEFLDATNLTINKLRYLVKLKLIQPTRVKNDEATGEWHLIFDAKDVKKVYKIKSLHKNGTGYTSIARNKKLFLK